MKLAGTPLEVYGDTMRIEGILVGNGGGKSVVFVLPGEPAPAVPTTHQFTIEEAEAWLAQTDDPTSPIFDGDTGIVKAIVRKATRQVDQNVAWACYARDGYTCRYCGVTGVPLTYDHYLAQAFGGKTTMENGRTACRPCNKLKGHMTIEEWADFQKARGFGGKI